ncbi:MAG: hypothetical protein A4E49_01165 [Methanosaeta sp. PtaU1.Bin112]|nr:MAG: hypothetical protein A4E49_01165 [Methanosaeta sp. PtaU1.Bin112]
MKLIKPIFMALILIMVCCSYSIAHPYSIGHPSSEIGNTTLNTVPAPGIIGSIGTGASIPVLREFVCNLMSACGMYPLGLGNNGDGATVNLGAFSFGKVESASHNP